MKKLPVSVRALMKIIGEVKGAADELPNLAIICERGAATGGFEGFLYGQGSQPTEKLHHIFNYDQDGLSPLDLRSIREADLAILVIDAEAHLGMSTTLALSGLKDLAIQHLVVVDNIESINDPETYLERLKNLFGMRIQDLIFVSSKARLGEDELIRATANKLSVGLIGLGCRYPVYRNVIADKAIRKSAMENAVVGGIAIIPGADMPLILANQVKLVLNIAQLYGYELSLNRAVEVLSIVGGGLFFRAVARQALDVVPVLGSVVKGAVAHLGTMALGMAAKKYFEAELLKDKLP